MSSPPGWSTPPPPPPPPPSPPPPPEGPGGARLRPLNVGDVLDGMFRLFVRHWRAYIGAIAAIVVPTQLVIAFLQRDLVSEVGLLEIFADPVAAQSAADMPSILDMGMPFATSIAVALLISPLLTGVASLLGARAHLGQAVEAGPALRAGLRRFPALIGANVLSLLAVAAVVAACMLPVAALAYAGGNVAVVAVLALPMGLLALAAVMAVYTFLLVAPVAVMVEERGPVSALTRSLSLVRARFWGVLGIGLLAWIISGIISSILAWPFTLVATLFGGAALFLTVATSGAIVAGVLSAPLMPNALALLYTDLRVRREGLDLEAMATEVERFGEGGGPV